MTLCRSRPARGLRPGGGPRCQLDLAAGEAAASVAKAGLASRHAMSINWMAELLRRGHFALDRP